MSRYVDVDNLVNAKILGISTRYVEGWNDAIDAIIEIEPTADVCENKYGEWHILDECSNEGVYCSVCHKKVFKYDFSNTMKWKNFNFCPNCGANMRKEIV